MVVIVLVLAIGGGAYVYFKKDNKPKTSIKGVVLNESTSSNPSLKNINIDKEDAIKDTKPSSEKASGIIKSVYSKDGKNYLDIDYVEFVSGGPNGVSMNNNNPKIRTFEINNDAKLLVRTYCADKTECTGEEYDVIEFNQFSKIFNEKGYAINNAFYLKSNPWNIEITNSAITKVTERFLP